MIEEKVTHIWTEYKTTSGVVITRDSAGHFTARTGMFGGTLTLTPAQAGDLYDALGELTRERTSARGPSSGSPNWKADGSPYLPALRLMCRKSW